MRTFTEQNFCHDFTFSSLSANNRPDLIIVFHSGYCDHSDTEISYSWTPTLKYVLDHNIPAVFTTYNESEAVHEQDLLDRLGAHFIRTPSENRWRGVLTYSDMLEERYQVYHLNYFWYIIQGGTRVH